jgi:spermidine synthase
MRYDLVLLDAFDHEYIPEHLLTREFLLEVRALLSERGVLAANTRAACTISNRRPTTAPSAFLRLKSGNRVILVRLGGLPDRDELARNADRVEDKLARFGVGKEWLLPLIQIETGWPPGTRWLTDQYSPSNLLNGSN